MGDLEPRINVPAVIAKGIISGIPLVGPVAAEVFWEVLPNKRLDRIEQVLDELGQRLSDVEPERVRRQMLEPVFVDLLDEGVRQATRTSSDQRLQEIAAVLAGGIREGDVAELDRKFLLHLLDELNDTEVLLLSMYGKEEPARTEIVKAHAAALVYELVAFAGPHSRPDVIEQEQVLGGHLKTGH
ncbi:MAG TPA: hypothetical protein VGJ22_14675 [Anaerolineales bacterium]|jgi:hypothetical protein